MKAKNSTINVSKTVGPSKGLVPGEGEEEVIAVHKFETSPAHVSVEYALTINLGNYESAKLSVSVTVPCYKEEIDDAYEFAEAWAKDRLKKERDSVVGKEENSSPL